MLEYCDQGTLEDELKHKFHFDEEKAKKVMHNILTGYASLY